MGADEPEDAKVLVFPREEAKRVAKALRDLPDRILECRAFTHCWSPIGTHALQNGGVRTKMTCTRCGTTKDVDSLADGTRRRHTNYVRPEGFSPNTGDARVFAEDLLKAYYSRIEIHNSALSLERALRRRA